MLVEILKKNTICIFKTRPIKELCVVPTLSVRIPSLADAEGKSLFWIDIRFGAQMEVYSKFILPKLLNLVMDNKKLDRFRQQVGGGATGRVLEVGLGSGLNLEYYGPAVTGLTGLDPSPELIEMARRKAVELDVDINIMEQSAENMEFATATFDTVISTWTLCSIADVAAALAEIRRVLKPGGQLIFIEHGLAPDKGVETWQNRLNGIWKCCAGGCHMNRPIDRLIGAAGFSINALETGYMEGGPRMLSYMYQGCAKPN